MILASIPLLNAIVFGAGVIAMGLGEVVSILNRQLEMLKRVHQSLHFK